MADIKPTRFANIGPEYFVDNGDGSFSQKVVSSSSGTTTVTGLPTSLGQKTAANSTSVVLSSDNNTVTPAATEVHLGSIGGTTVVVSTSQTRPNDTTTYAAGDAVANSTSAPVPLTFSGCARINAGSGVVLNAVLVDEANQTLKGSFELWLFDTTVTATNDNAAMAITNANLETAIAVFVFDTAFVANSGSGASGNVMYFPSNARTWPFKCGASSTSLFGLMIVRNAYVPIAQEKFLVRLEIAQD